MGTYYYIPTYGYDWEDPELYQYLKNCILLLDGKKLYPFEIPHLEIHIPHNTDDMITYMTSNLETEDHTTFAGGRIEKAQEVKGYARSIVEIPNYPLGFNNSIFTDVTLQTSTRHHNVRVALNLKNLFSDPEIQAKLKELTNENNS